MNLKEILTVITKNWNCNSPLLPTFRSIMHHFKLSRKKLNSLNEALDVLKMKPVPLLSLCLTRMSYLLTGWEQAVNLLLLIHVLANHVHISLKFPTVMIIFWGFQDVLALTLFYCLGQETWLDNLWKLIKILQFLSGGKVQKYLA